MRLNFTTVPDGHALPPVEITIVNDDLGFLPGTLRVFPNGAWTLRPTGHLDVTRPAGRGVFLDLLPDLSNVENSIWLSPYDVEIFQNQGYRDQLFMHLRRE